MSESGRRPRTANAVAGASVAALILCFAHATAITHATNQALAQPVVDATVEQARQLFASGRYAESAESLKSIPEPPAVVLFWLGRAQFELRDYAAAVQAFERGVALAQNDSELHRWLGRAYGEEASRKRSITLAIRVRRQFEEAVGLDPTNIAARRDLLEFYLQAPRLLGGGDDKARQQVAAIAALDPVAGHLASAAFAQHRGDASRAGAEYAAVMATRPASVEPYFEAAEFY